MSLAELIAVVPPPKKTTTPGTAKRVAKIEKLVGTSLPKDYLEFGVQYGSGRFFDGHIHVVNVFRSEYKEWLDSRLDAMRQLHPYGLYGDFEIYPQTGGLLPWGDDENGNILCWSTDGSPEDWGVVAARHGGGVEKWDMQFSTFLAKFLTKKIKVKFWDDPITKKRLVFKPEAPEA